MTEETGWRVEADMRIDKNARPYNPEKLYLSGWNIVSDNEEIVGCEGIIPSDNAAQRAHKMAAAPELLDALIEAQDIINSCVPGNSWQGTRKRIADAVAKATIEEPPHASR